MEPVGPEPQQPSLQVTEYVEKARAILAITLVLVWTSIIIIWTYHAALLPGDVTGQIAGGFNTLLGIVVGYYFATAMNNPKKNDGSK